MKRVWAQLAALASGLAAGLAHPPFGVLPGLLGFALLLTLLEREGPRPLAGAFWRGWLAGLGYFAVSVWWVVEAFLVDAATYGWMAPFALAFLAGGLALFWGLGGLIYRAAGARSVWRPLVFAGAFGAAEWLRGHVLTGFPWNLPGEAWRAGSAPSQWAAFVGAYGLTFITLALAAAAALALPPAPARRRWTALGVVAGGLVVLYGVGAARLAAPLPSPADAPVVRIVQADVDQKDKWRPENLETIFADYMRLSTAPAARRPDVVVWPEGALPAVIDDLLAPGSPYLARLNQGLAPGQTLMMGANRAEPDGAGGARYFNALVALRRQETGLLVTGVYDKHRLVPFGEYLPAGDLMGRLGVRSLVHMPEDFSAGPPPAPIRPAGLPPVQPLICYEALFPGLARREAGEVAAQWLLNVSNDAWFGVTSGPLQHLNLASYRAIEQGLPIVRATPTGVSAVIDARGRIVPKTRMELGVSGTVDARLPPSLGDTLYGRVGDWPFGAMIMLAIFAGLLGRRQTS